MFDFSADPLTRLRPRCVVSRPYGTVAYSPPRPTMRTRPRHRCLAGSGQGSRGMRRSACTLAEHDHPNGLEQDKNIEQQSVVLHIVEVVLELLDRFFHVRAVGIAHLRPTG